MTNKIGIITIHKAENYGAFLQAFALQKVLQDNNYNVSIIDYSNKKISDDYKIINKNNKKKTLKNILFLNKVIKRKNNFKKCQKTYFNLSQINQNYSVCIVGSDQVWNLELTGGYDGNYSSENIKADKKVSYASSIGKESLIEKFPNEYKRILDNLNFISVREETAREKLLSLTNKEIKTVIDPTLLIDGNEWSKMTLENDIKEDYIFSYFVAVTQDNYDLLKKISVDLNLKTIGYSQNPKEYNMIKSCYTDSPISFITRIKNSKIVYTSSFHGTVFSILFKKNFWVTPPKGKEARITDLLNKLGLSNRIITKENYSSKDLNEAINYEQVENNLEKIRQDSIDWLLSKLGD